MQIKDIWSLFKIPFKWGSFDRQFLSFLKILFPQLAQAQKPWAKHLSKFIKYKKEYQTSCKNEKMLENMLAAASGSEEQVFWRIHSLTLISWPLRLCMSHLTNLVLLKLLLLLLLLILILFYYCCYYYYYHHHYYFHSSMNSNQPTE